MSTSVIKKAIIPPEIDGIQGAKGIDMGTNKTLKILLANYAIVFMFGVDGSTPIAYVLFYKPDGISKISLTQNDVVSFVHIDGGIQCAFRTEYSNVAILSRKNIVYQISP